MLASLGYVFPDHDVILGRGRHCVVKLATSTRYAKPRKVAIKVAAMRTPASFREAEILSKLNHDHIVEMYDFFDADGRTHIVLELVEQGNLRHFVRQRGRIGEAATIRICRQVFDAMAYLHDVVAVVHCDLKCENVLVDSRGDVRIADFGQAIDLSDNPVWKSTSRIGVRPGNADVSSSPNSSADTNLDSRPVAADLTLGGSPAYAAPEVLDGTASDLRAADVWSAGVVAFFIMTTYLPFGCHGIAAIREAMNRPLCWPRPLSQINKPQRTFVQSALTMKPEERPNSRNLLELLHTGSNDDHKI